MHSPAIIVAEEHEQRQAIADCINTLERFEPILFCATLQEVTLHLGQTTNPYIFCEAGYVEEETLRISATLASLAKKHNCPLAFFSAADPEELLRQGILPPGSLCFNYQTPSRDILEALESPGRDHQDPTPLNLLQDSDYRPALNPNPGLYSRFSFDNFLLQEISRSRLTGRPFTLLMIEPQVRELNQEQSREWSSLATEIKKLVRTSDLLCRLEQKQLALLLPETSNKNAQQVIDRIYHLIESSVLKIKIDLSLPQVSHASIVNS